MANLAFHPTIAEALLDLRMDHERLFFLTTSGVQVVFRPLTIKEAQVISSSDDIAEYLIDDWVVGRCVLVSSLPLDQCIAGAIHKVSECVLNNSMVKDEKGVVKLLQERREAVGSLQSAIEAYICASFKNHTPSTARDLTQHEQMGLVAMSELLLDRKLDLDEILNPGKKKKRPKVRTPHRQPPVQGGYSSIHAGPTDADDILSEGSADVVDVNKDNSAMGGL